MRTIIKTHNVYTIDELSDEAKEKALNDFNEHNYIYDLEEQLTEYINGELEQSGYKVLKSIKVYYSLSYSQGDGVMFEGTIEDKDGNVYTIKHNGHYYHEHSKTINAMDKEENDIDTEEFDNNFYIPLCRKVEKVGYSEIEYQQSMEHFIELCDLNEYTFLENGTMFNE